MPVTLDGSATSDVVQFLTPLAKVVPLDGRQLAASIRPAQEDSLLVSCTPDTGRITGLEVQVEGQGDEVVSLSLQKLLDMCKRSSSSLTLATVDGLVTTGTWQTPSLPFRELPVGLTQEAEVDATEFRRALSAAKYAASDDPARPQLAMVHFGRKLVRACDGLRYHEERTDLDIEWDVPVSCTAAVERLAGQAPDGLLRLWSSATHQGYGIDGAFLAVPRPAATYLSLDEVVAAPARAHNNHVLRVDKAALRAAVKDVAIMAGDSRTVRLDLLDAKTLAVSATDGLNAGRVDVACEWSGDPRTLRFWTSPFLQLIGTSSKELVELRLGPSTLKALTAAVVWEGESFSLLNQVRGD